MCGHKHTSLDNDLCSNCDKKDSRSRGVVQKTRPHSKYLHRDINRCPVGRRKQHRDRETQWKRSVLDKLTWDCQAKKHERCFERQRRELSPVKQRHNVGQLLSARLCFTTLFVTLLFLPRPRQWPSRLPPRRLWTPQGAASAAFALQSTCGRGSRAGEPAVQRCWCLMDSVEAATFVQVQHVWQETKQGGHEAPGASLARGRSQWATSALCDITKGWFSRDMDFFLCFLYYIKEKSVLTNML